MPEFEDDERTYTSFAPPDFDLEMNRGLREELIRKIQDRVEGRIQILLDDNFEENMEEGQSPPYRWLASEIDSILQDPLKFIQSLYEHAYTMDQNMVALVHYSLKAEEAKQLIQDALEKLQTTSENLQRLSDSFKHRYQ